MHAIIDSVDRAAPVTSDGDMSDLKYMRRTYVSALNTIVAHDLFALIVNCGLYFAFFDNHH
jgi:hypothetical protein